MNKRRLFLVLSGLFFLIFSVFLFLISNSFKISIPLLNQPVLEFVILLIVFSTVYLISIYWLRNYSINSKDFIWIILVGLLVRIITLFSYPILEDDYFRYLWDGGVTANAINPYLYSPEDVLSGNSIPELEQLASDSNGILNKVNHPYLKTIYPPVAQLVFAVSHFISPWDIYLWRGLLLFFDFIVLILLLRILSKLNLPRSNIIIYWWNPLLINEIFNSGHLDIIVFPFVLIALYLLLYNRIFSSVISLAISIGVKIWPIFLFPLAIRNILNKPKKLIGVVFLFVLLILALLVPFVVGGFGDSSGLVAYAERWENNDSLFRVFVIFSEKLLNEFDIHPGHGQKVARYFVLFLVGLISFLVAFKNEKDKEEVIFNKSLLIIGLAFLLSPTQYPWYYTWLIPFLTIAPRWSFLILTPLLNLYYLRYYFEPRGELDLFINYIPWIEFIPVWILLLIELRNRNKVKFN